MTIEANKDTVRRFIEALDSNDLSVLTEICTSECAAEWRDGINVDPWADHHMSLTGLIAEGDAVAALVNSHGRVVGEIAGIWGHGKPFVNNGIVIYRFSDTKISSVEPYFDLFVVAEQLGATLVASDR